MKSKDNAWFWVVIVLYTLITFLRLINHQPWFDEAHAWSIAQELSLFDVFNLMAFEGHTFIWYLLLMPFAKTNFFYPWPMLIMNYLFAFVSVVLLWKKAPFSNITKTLITFSFPFFACLPILARCYSIGVMLLFLLAILYEKRLKYPLIYSTLIILCANTSVMAILGAAAFGFIFAYDLIRESLKDNISKKDFILSFVIMAFGAVLILWQLGFTSKLLTSESGDFVSKFLGFLFGDFIVLNWISLFSFILGILAVGTVIAISKNIKSIFFYIFTIGGLIAIFLTVYAGWPHHFIFLYIYTLLSGWFFLKNKKRSRVIDIAIAIMFASLIFNDKSFDIIYFNSRSMDIAKFIINDENLRNSRIILYEAPSKSTLPVLQANNVDVWDYCSGAPANSSIIMNISTPLCTMKDRVYLTPYIEKVLSKDKINYSVIGMPEDRPFEHVFMVKQGNKRVIFEFDRRIKNSGYLLYKTSVFSN